MNIRSIALCLVVATASDVTAQQSWQDQLKRELVSIRGDKMVIEAFSLDRISLPQYQPVELQVRYYSEAPRTGVISRDNFVAFTTALTVTVLQQSLAEALNVPARDFLAAYESREIPRPIGRPDLEIKVYMTADGFQLEVVNTATGETSRTTQTWDRVIQTGR
jgi:hypothetical protein